MKRLTVKRGAVLVLTALAASCTMKKQEAPGFSGPSEFGTSISVALTPDILQQDGASQSIVTVTARGPNGAPLGSLALRAEIRVDGTPTDFGTLSTRNLVTTPDGRAMLTYTAPPPPPIPIDTMTVVDVAITPVGTDFNNSATRLASLRLVPRGMVLPPDSLQAAFSFSPSAPVDNETVLFDASGSQAPNNAAISMYAWEFGDGQRATGRTASHAYRAPGSYTARLTISDAVGRSGSVSRTVAVGAGARPTALFTVSPGAPAVNERVNFNAGQSTPAPGRSIVSYAWDFGEGSRGQGAQTSHVFASAGSYSVVLTVTDDAGRVATIAQSVVVGGGAPTATFTVSPAEPEPNQPVFFNASQSTQGPNQTFMWEFGDGSPTRTGVQTTHTFGRRGVYTVTLTVTDSTGRQTVVSRQVSVDFRQ